MCFLFLCMIFQANIDFLSLLTNISYIVNEIVDIQDLGAQIADLRKEKRMTQAEVAKCAGVSRALISDLESGQLHDPGVKKLFRILRVLGKSIQIVPFEPPTLDDLLAEQGLANKE